FSCPNLFLSSRAFRHDATTNTRKLHGSVDMTVLTLVVHAQLGVTVRVGADPAFGVSAGRAADSLDSLALEGVAHEALLSSSTYRNNVLAPDLFPYREYGRNLWVQPLLPGVTMPSVR